MKTHNDGIEKAAQKNRTGFKNNPVPHYFTASTTKLVLLSLITGGFYIVYWSYKNWKAIEATSPLNKKGEKDNLYPKLSSLFFGIASYDLFTRIKQVETETKAKAPMAAGQYALGVFILNFVGLSFIPIIKVQKHLNDIKLTAFGEENISKSTSVGEVLMVIIGIILLAGNVARITQDKPGTTYQISAEAQQKKDELDTEQAQYSICSSDLTSSKDAVDTNSQSAVDAFNAKSNNCEQVRLKLNNLVDEYNNLIK